jgi:hypothetical protein
MKKNIISRLFVTATALAFLAGCTKDSTNSNTDEIYTIAATMSAANEVGTGTSAGNTTTYPGTGTTTGTYNATTNQLQYNITWSGLSGAASVGHFHGPALPGASASPIIYFNLLNNGNSGTAAGQINLTDAQEADLLAGKWYANIHTTANAGGEIRGQVTATK